MKKIFFCLFLFLNNVNASENELRLTIAATVSSIKIKNISDIKNNEIENNNLETKKEYCSGVICYKMENGEITYTKKNEKNEIDYKLNINKVTDIIGVGNNLYCISNGYLYYIEIGNNKNKNEIIYQEIEKNDVKIKNKYYKNGILYFF